MTDMCAICADDESPLIGEICPSCYEKSLGKKVNVQESVDTEGTTTVVAMPEFDNWEDVIKFSESIKKGQVSSVAKKTPKKTAKPKAKRSTIPPGAQVEDDTVWQARHIFMRKGDEPAKVKGDAKLEKRYAGDGILVFFHAHSYGKPCTNDCGEL